MRLLVALTGASGAVIGVRLLEELRQRKVETFLMISRWGEHVLREETGKQVEELRGLAAGWFAVDNLGAPPASGTFGHNGMVIVPCSMKTLAGIAQGYSLSLIERAADVTLKERRPLVVVPRETPLNQVHLENMLRLGQAGGTVMPFMPAFYAHPGSLEEAVDLFVGRVLALLGLERTYSTGVFCG